MYLFLEIFRVQRYYKQKTKQNESVLLIINNHFLALALCLALAVAVAFLTNVVAKERSEHKILFGS